VGQFTLLDQITVSLYVTIEIIRYFAQLPHKHWVKTLQKMPNFTGCNHNFNIHRIASAQPVCSLDTCHSCLSEFLSLMTTVL